MDDVLELPITKSMARVLEAQGKLEEAEKIYRTLMRRSADRELAEAVSRIEEKKAGTYGNAVRDPAVLISALKLMLGRISARKRTGDGRRQNHRENHRPDELIKPEGKKARRLEFLENLILRIRQNSRII